MTEHVAAPRRGRPPKAIPAVTQELADTETETPGTPVKRRRRASVGGHALKLQAPERPGYVRRFFNDTGNRLAEADALGYDVVSDPGIQSTDLGSSVSRLAGVKPTGEPLRTVLMETPEELYAQGMAEREAHNRQIDEAITAGIPTEGQIAPAGQQFGEGSIQRDR